MPKMYVLRCERNGVLESESGKEEKWLVVAELDIVLEKVLIDFGKLFQRIGAVRLYERVDWKFQNIFRTWPSDLFRECARASAQKNVWETFVDFLNFHRMVSLRKLYFVTLTYFLEVRK